MAIRILVVDDHRNTRDALALGLALLAIDVRTAGSAAEAMLTLEQYACDWLVCDVRMPAMDGIELVTRVHAARPEVRLILMTAYDVSPDEQARIAATGAQLLIKPVTAETVARQCSEAPRAGG
jgi:two-component system OmpR family response regulator